MKTNFSNGIYTIECNGIVVKHKDEIEAQKLMMAKLSAKVGA